MHILCLLEIFIFSDLRHLFDSSVLHFQVQPRVRLRLQGVHAALPPAAGAHRADGQRLLHPVDDGWTFLGSLLSLSQIQVRFYWWEDEGLIEKGSRTKQDVLTRFWPFKKGFVLSRNLHCTGHDTKSKMPLCAKYSKCMLITKPLKGPFWSIWTKSTYMYCVRRYVRTYVDIL